MIRRLARGIKFGNKLPVTNAYERERGIIPYFHVSKEDVKIEAKVNAFSSQREKIQLEGEFNAKNISEYITQAKEAEKMDLMFQNRREVSPVAIYI